MKVMGVGMSASSLVASLLPLLGALLGALVVSFTNWLSVRTTLRASREESRFDLRRDEYFGAVDIAHRMRSSLGDIGVAMSGRSEPDDSSSEAEIEEADRRDMESAMAITLLFETSKDMDLQAHRLSAIGSDDVRDQFSALWSVVRSYLDRELSRDDHRFIRANFDEALLEYDENMFSFLNAIRSDLRVEEA